MEQKKQQKSQAQEKAEEKLENQLALSPKNNSLATQQTKKIREGGLKVPDSLPAPYKEPLGEKIKKSFFKKSSITEIVREPTAGGVIFRMTENNEDIEILLIQDSKNRWTIPKGHIEMNETARQAAIREITEETGLKDIELISWLGKIQFKYRREERLVLMTTQIYLVHSLDDHEKLKKEKWMNNIKWFKFSEAIDLIEYKDIEKLMLVGKKKIRNGEF